MIGAIYIDRGYNYVKDFILRIWKNNIAKSHITVLDPKTKLQEHSLKNFRKLPVYRLINSTGPRHNPLYKISVRISGSREFMGTGNSKQQAEQNGALNLLKHKNIN